MSPAAQGALIALEGIDGAGTTTQARLLVEWLIGRGERAHLTCEPSSGPVGRLLRDILGHRVGRPVDAAAVALLFAADRVDHLRAEIEPLRQQGTHVVTDRYLVSSLAYQSLEHDLSWVAEINRLAPDPDLTIYLRVDPGLARQRREARGSTQDLFEVDEMQRRISANYDQLLGSCAGSREWILPDPLGSNWIHQGPAGSSTGSGIGSSFESSSKVSAGSLTRPRTVVLDGALPVETIQKQIAAIVQIAALGAELTGSVDRAQG